MINHVSQIIDESDLIMHYFIMRVDSCTYKLSIQIYCNSFAPLSRFCRAYNWWDCESAASHSSAALTAMRHRAVMPLKLSLYWFLYFFILTEKEISRIEQFPEIQTLASCQTSEFWTWKFKIRFESVYFTSKTKIERELHAANVQNKHK